MRRCRGSTDESADGLPTVQQRQPLHGCARDWLASPRSPRNNTWLGQAAFWHWRQAIGEKRERTAGEWRIASAIGLAKEASVPCFGGGPQVAIVFASHSVSKNGYAMVAQRVSYLEACTPHTNMRRGAGGGEAKDVLRIVPGRPTHRARTGAVVGVRAGADADDGDGWRQLQGSNMSTFRMPRPEQLAGEGSTSARSGMSYGNIQECGGPLSVMYLFTWHLGSRAGGLGNARRFCWREVEWEQAYHALVHPIMLLPAGQLASGPSTTDRAPAGSGLRWRYRFDGEGGQLVMGARQSCGRWGRTSDGWILSGWIQPH